MKIKKQEQNRKKIANKKVYQDGFASLRCAKAGGTHKSAQEQVCVKRFDLPFKKTFNPPLWGQKSEQAPPPFLFCLLFKGVKFINGNRDVRQICIIMTYEKKQFHLWLLDPS